MKSLLIIFSQDNEVMIKQLVDNHFQINILETREGVLPDDYQLCLVFFKDTQEELLKNIISHFALTQEQYELTKMIYQKLKDVDFHIPMVKINDLE